MAQATITRMTCGKHRPMFAVPEGAVVDWSALAPFVYQGPERPERGGYGHGPREYLRCRADGCRRAMRATTVRGSYSATTKCGARCVSATGPACDCQCRGENHGGGAW